MRYDDEHKEKTRAKVLQVASRAIREDGPGGVGVAAIMAEAGLTHGGFYGHFKSKDDLVTEAIRQMFRDASGKFAATTGDKAAAEASQRGQSAGRGALEAMGEAEPEALASSVLSERVGAVSLARAVADPAQSDAILKASRASLRARLGLEALR